MLLVSKGVPMDDKMRARNYYAAAVSLFQEPSIDDCEQAIELLEKSLNLYSGLDVRVFIGDVWHYLLKSLDPHNDLATYEKYLDSPAWDRKRDAVIERNGGQCVCGAQATEMHHKTYSNIGSEPLSDLVMLCEECHERIHESRVPKDDNELYERYWSEFHVYYTSKNMSPTPLGIREENPKNYYFKMESFNPFHIGFSISLLNSSEISANLNLNKQIDKTQKIFKALKSGQEYFQRFFEEELLFLDDRSRAFFIIGCKKEADIRDPKEWLNQFEWLCMNLEELNKVFLPALRVTQHFEATQLQQ